MDNSWIIIRCNRYYDDFNYSWFADLNLEVPKKQCSKFELKAFCFKAIVTVRYKIRYFLLFCWWHKNYFYFIFFLRIISCTQNTWTRLIGFLYDHVSFIHLLWACFLPALFLWTFLFGQFAVCESFWTKHRPVFDVSLSDAGQFRIFFISPNVSQYPLLL